MWPPQNATCPSSSYDSPYLMMRHLQIGHEPAPTCRQLGYRPTQGGHEHIWNVEEPKEAGLWWYLRTYLISFAGILGLGFLLAVSLVVSALLGALSSWRGSAAAIGRSHQLRGLR